MSVTAVLWALSLGGLLLLYYLYTKTAETLYQERREFHQLKEKHKKLKRTLVNRGRRLDVLLSTVSEVVLRVDRTGRVLGGNEHASELFQLDNAPQLPQSMLIFYRDSEWLNQYQQAIKALPQKTVLSEMKIHGRTFLPRLVALGEKEALLLCMDVTAYMQLQQKQRSLFENLMHDLKTPLTSLLGYARSIEVFADDAELRKEATTVIAKEAKHINDLMNSMLTLNQIEFQKAEHEVVTDVIATSLQIWDSLKVQMAAKNISLDWETALELLEVKMAEADVHRVMMNIAENALKFSPEHARIRCEITRDNGFARIEIQDQGYGISESHLPRVTERFYRVDNVRGRKKEEGHGLGLAIVKETLQRDGGTLTLSNCEGGGLLVTMEIPLAEKTA